MAANPGFPGTRGQLVRLTQRFLDRCIFILFCEDMGRELRYPPELLRDLLTEYSMLRSYNPDGSGPWSAARDLFRAMRDGGPFGGHTIERFNGGLFDAEITTLARQETEMNTLDYRLYDLTPKEIALVEAG